MKVYRFYLLFFLACIPLIGHSESERELLRNEIALYSSDLSCNSNEDCKTVGIGDRPCGGYGEYIIYSTNAIAVEKMEDMASRYYELDRKYNSENMMSSICSVEMPRVSACIHAKCVDLGDEANAETPMHWAAYHQDVDLIDDLLSKGMDIDSKGRTLGQTALQSSIERGVPLEIVQELLNRGANVNASNHPIEESRRTPLHIAVLAERYDVIELLVRSGANKSAGDYTPYYYAKHYLKDHPRYNEIKKLLAATVTIKELEINGLGIVTVGMKVNHTTYGNGTIIEIVEFPDETHTVNVDFGENGKKWLGPEYSDLKPSE